MRATKPSLTPWQRAGTAGWQSLLVATAALIGWWFAAAQDQVRPPEPELEVYLVLDTSASMSEVDLPDGTKLSFDDVKNRLGAFLMYELPDQATLTIITFAEDAKVLTHGGLNGQPARQAHWEKLWRVNASGRYTNLARALALALNEIARSAAEHGTRHRLLFLLSDGKNNPRPGEQLTLDLVRRLVEQPQEAVRDAQLQVAMPPAKLLELVRDGRGLRPREDFDFWYSHIGEPDPVLREIAERWGRLIPIQGDLRLRFTELNRHWIAVQTLPGDSEFEVPSEADRDAGEELRLRGPVGEAVGLELAVPKQPREGTIELVTNSVKMAARPQPFTLRFRVRGLVPGRHRFQVRFKGKAPLNLVHPDRLTVELIVPVPTVTVQARQALPPLTAKRPTAEAVVLVIPDAVARQLAPRIAATLQGDTPRGITVTVTPETFRGDRPTEVRLRARIADRGAIRDFRPFRLAVALSTDNPYIRFDRTSVAVELRIQKLAFGLTTARFERLLARDKDEVTLQLQAPTNALRSLGSIRLHLGAAVPRSDNAPPLQLSSNTLTFSGDRPRATIRAMFHNLPAPPEKPVTWEYRIPVSTDHPLVDLTTPELTVTILREPKPRVRKLRLLASELKVRGQLRPGVSAELPLPVEAPEDVSRLPLAVEEVRPLQAGAPVVECRIATADTEPGRRTVRLRVSTTEEFPPGVWRYRVALRTTEESYVVEPAAITIVIDRGLLLEIPPALRVGVYRWPFQTRVWLPKGDSLPESFRPVFRYSFDQTNWFDGTVEVSESPDHVEIVCRGGNPLPQSVELQPGGTATLYCELVDGSRVLQAWQVPVQVKPPLIEYLDLQLEGSDTQREEGIDDPDYLVFRASGRCRLVLRASLRHIPPEGTQFVCLLQREPAVADVAEAARQLRVAFASSANQGIVRIEATSLDLVSGQELCTLELPEAGWFRSRPGQQLRYAVALVVVDPDGVEHWGATKLVRIVVPPARAWGWWLVGLLMIFVTGGAAAGVFFLSRRVPKIAPLDVDPATAVPRVGQFQLCLYGQAWRFEPSRPTNPMVGLPSPRAMRTGPLGLWRSVTLKATPAIDRGEPISERVLLRVTVTPFAAKLVSSHALNVEGIEYAPQEPISLTEHGADRLGKCYRLQVLVALPELGDGSFETLDIVWLPPGPLVRDSSPGGSPGEHDEGQVSEAAQVEPL